MEEKIEQLRQEAAKAVKQAVGSLGDPIIYFVNIIYWSAIHCNHTQP